MKVNIAETCPPQVGHSGLQHVFCQINRLDSTLWTDGLCGSQGYGTGARSDVSSLLPGRGCK